MTQQDTSYFRRYHNTKPTNITKINDSVDEQVAANRKRIEASIQRQQLRQQNADALCEV
jgi:hypothetical protein